MKILQIHIENLASIETADIDFEQGILAREPLFLICGETGAGKSTILDAICLALYNKVPRLQNTARETFADITNDLNVCDVRNLLRRGSGSGKCSVIFSTTDGSRYQADWSIRRAHNKADGKLQDSEWTVIDLSTQKVMAAKKNESEELLVKLIGLDFGQFTRTVLLAQNQFARFLQSEEKEKSAILEMLTGTELYSKISTKIHQIHRDTEFSNQQLHCQLTNIKLLSSEEIDILQNQIKTFQKEQSAIQQQMESINLQINWLINHQQQLNELHLAQDKYNQLLSESQSETIIQKQLLIEQYNTTEPIREIYRKITEDNIYIIDANTQIQRQKNNYKNVLANIHIIEKNKQEKQEELDQLAIDIKQDESRKNIFEHYQILINQLNQAENAIKQKKESEQQKEKSGKSITDLTQKLNDLTTKYEENQNFIKLQEQKIQAINTQLEQIDIQKLRKQKENLLSNLNSLRQALNIWNTYQSNQTEYKESSKKIEQQERDIVELQKRIPTLQNDELESRSRYTEAQRTYNFQKLTIDDATQRLRAELVEGKPCPVCGNTHHLHQTEEMLHKIVAESQSAVEKALSTWNNAVKKQEQCAAQINAKNDALLADKTTQQSLVQKLSNSRNEWEKCTLIPYETNDVTLYIQECTEKNTIETQNIQKQIEKAEKLEQSLKNLLQDKNKIEKLIKLQVTDIESYKSKLTQYENDFLAAKKDIEWSQSNYQKYIETIQKYMNSDKWLTAWENDADKFKTQLNTCYQKWQSNNTRQQSLQEEYKTQLDRLNNLYSVSQKIIQLFPDWEFVTIGQPINSENVLSELSDIYNNIYTYNSNIHKYQNNKNLYEIQLENKIQEYNKVSVIQIDTNRIKYLSAISYTDIQQHQKEVNAVFQLLTKIKATQETLMKNVEQHYQDPHRPAENENIETLKIQHENLKKNADKLSIQIIDCQKDIVINNENIEQYGKLHEQIQTSDIELTHWNTLYKLFGSADGKAFRNIAQSYTLRLLLAKANDQLRRLSSRYLLECEAGSLALLIRDRYMDNAIRPVSTLSGGESFLVSLALALGLSSLTDEHLKVETLFIDEGFGTLSGNCLDTVMNVLEQLHNRGCKVGIISHVELLKERIKTQIRVSRKNQSKSVVEICQE